MISKVEVFLHASITVICTVSMLTTAIFFSSPERKEFPQFQRWLSRSWLSDNLWIDNSDAQFASFRGNLRVLVPLMLLHLGLSRSTQFASNSQFVRLVFSIVFSCAFLLIYNGVSGSLKLGAVLLANYFGAKTLRNSVFAPAFAWIFGLGVLIGTHYYRGFEFSWISPHFEAVDRLGYGISSNWWDPLRFCFLRMVSFNLDYYWKCRDSLRTEDQMSLLSQHAEKCIHCSTESPQTCAKRRIEVPHHESVYSMANYLTYTLYIPLYLAGPIITFNDFTAQFKRRPQTTNSFIFLARYSLRWIACLALMELFIHSLFVIAVAKSDVWKHSFTLYEVFCLGYLNLKHIWLKLLVIWRFFRMWALWDGIETVENMNRCMSNNYSTSGFWRSWHRSFNRWIIRYIFIPMGGSKLYFVNLFVTFMFVAIWHDLRMNLLLWGVLISISIIPETLALKFFPHKKLATWRYYPYVCGVGAVLNIYLMIFANTVGFGAANGGISRTEEVGIDLTAMVWNAQGALSILGICLFFFCLTQVMFAYREWESGTAISNRD